MAFLLFWLIFCNGIMHLQRKGEHRDEVQQNRLEAQTETTSQIPTAVNFYFWRNSFDTIKTITRGIHFYHFIMSFHALWLALVYAKESQANACLVYGTIHHYTNWNTLYKMKSQSSWPRWISLFDIPTPKLTSSTCTLYFLDLPQRNATCQT